MEHKDIYELLLNLNIPIAYDHFKSNKDEVPPFAIYREIKPETFKADDITYYRNYNFEIELVTDKKDVVLQKQIEKLLTDNNIPYDIDDEVWDQEEKIYHNFYEI